MSPKKALIVCTSVEKYANLNKPTGLWFAEASHFYDVLKAAGWSMDVVSPRGGYVPLDPMSLGEGAMSEGDWKLYHDADFRNKLGNSLSPTQVNAADYSVIYYTGGHGVIWDFPDNSQLQQIAASIYESGGIVSGVCHGVAGLFNIKLNSGINLIKGKKVTGFTNEEETMVGLEKVVPFLTEDVLKERGGLFECVGAFQPHVVSDHRLITGQNPASGGLVARKVLDHH